MQKCDKSNNVFELDFEDKTISKLIGNKYGYITFYKQVDYSISYDKPITIIFPDYINYISESFIGGFFGEMFKTLGIKGIEEKVTIKSNTIPNIKEMVIGKLKYYTSDMFDFA